MLLKILSYLATFSAGVCLGAVVVAFLTAAKRADEALADDPDPRPNKTARICEFRRDQIMGI